MGKNSKLLKQPPSILFYMLSNSNTELCAFLFEGGFAGGAREFSWFTLIYQQGLQDLSTTEK